MNWRNALVRWSVWKPVDFDRWGEQEARTAGAAELFSLLSLYLAKRYPLHKSANISSEDLPAKRVYKQGCVELTGGHARRGRGKERAGNPASGCLMPGGLAEVLRILQPRE